MNIPFNKPYLSGNEIKYIKHAIKSGKISGDGLYTKKCHKYFEEKYKFKKIFLTTSCTDALEMAAILTDIKPDDEVIAPSFTFVSTVNAFVLRGAKIIFADSENNTPCINASQIESLISPKTKAIIPVHYAGIACDMDPILMIARKYKLIVVEDAAQAIESFYKGKPLGTFGDLSTFSFHETKNIISGEGGMLAVNKNKYIKRAEIIREKGTNRSAFFRGEVNKYGWVDMGSSFLPSEIISAFLYAQLENMDKIQKKRISIWNTYYGGLSDLEKKGFIQLPTIPQYASNNGHMFYILCENLKTRSKLIEYLRRKNIMAVFHYLPLHESSYYKSKYHGSFLPNVERYAKCLLRLPLFYEINKAEINHIIDSVIDFFNNK